MRFRQAVYPQLWTIFAIFAAMVVVAVWQSDFVMKGAASNWYLNGAIFGGILFGVGLMFWNLLSLKTEFDALDALYEAYDDSQIRCGKGALPVEVRDQRLREPANVFSPPNFLGSAFKLLYPPMQRDLALKIPSSTGKQIVEDVENRIMATEAFGNYIASLMVLLGLLGTFIGLLVTVGSVGSILASLDFSAGASIDQVSNLMKSLEAPLGGMATGFSSSLFGLIGSLMLGMMSKVARRSYNALLVDFEEWINRVAQVEKIAGAGGVEDDVDWVDAARRSDGSVSGSKLLLSVSRSIVKRLDTVSEASTGSRGLLHSVAETAALTRTDIERLATANLAALEAMQGIMDRLERQDALYEEREAAREARERDHVRRLEGAVVAAGDMVEGAAERIGRHIEAIPSATAGMAAALKELGPATARCASAAEAAQAIASEMAQVLAGGVDEAGRRAERVEAAAQRLEAASSSALQASRKAAAAAARARDHAASAAAAERGGELWTARLARDAVAAVRRVSRTTADPRLTERPSAPATHAGSPAPEPASAEPREADAAEPNETEPLIGPPTPQIPQETGDEPKAER